MFNEFKTDGLFPYVSFKNKNGDFTFKYFYDKLKNDNFYENIEEINEKINIEWINDNIYGMFFRIIRPVKYNNGTTEMKWFIIK